MDELDLVTKIRQLARKNKTRQEIMNELNIGFSQLRRLIKQYDLVIRKVRAGGRKPIIVPMSISDIKKNVLETPTVSNNNQISVFKSGHTGEAPKRRSNASLWYNRNAKRN